MEAESKFTVQDKLILAPMVRIGTTPFRVLALRNGADLVFTEELIANKLANTQRVYNELLDTIDYVSEKDGNVVLRITKEERDRLVLQIGANDPDIALKAALKVKEDIVAVDVNMGCPKHFSTHGNMGSKLLSLPTLAKEILENLVKNVGLPVSCKIRLLETPEETKDFIQNCESAGISHLTVHLRKREQTQQIKADWSSLKPIKEYVSVPLVANGDILSPDDIYKIKTYSNCDGVMIARGAIHNPAIFREYKEKIIINSTEEVFDNNYKIIEDLPLNEEGGELELILNNDKDGIFEHNKLDGKVNNLEPEEDDNKLKVSVRLTTALKEKYKDIKIDIVNHITDYIKIAIDTGNSFHNTKYNILYMLKTHKKFIDLFNKIQRMKNYEELCREMNLEDYLSNALKKDERIKYFLNAQFYKLFPLKNDKNQ